MCENILASHPYISKSTEGKVQSFIDYVSKTMIILVSDMVTYMYMYVRKHCVLCRASMGEPELESNHLMLLKVS